MAKGTIRRLMDRGYGFIKTEEEWSKLCVVIGNPGLPAQINRSFTKSWCDKQRFSEWNGNPEQSTSD